jgi:hypothetical protein
MPIRLGLTLPFDWVPDHGLLPIRLGLTYLPRRCPFDQVVHLLRLVARELLFGHQKLALACIQARAVRIYNQVVHLLRLVARELLFEHQAYLTDTIGKARTSSEFGITRRHACKASEPH